MLTPNPIKAEQLAYWFFRLNGCLNLVNFLVHHERRGQEGTDVDILAVRFPFRKELAISGTPMTDHPIFDGNRKIDLIIAEVKLGKCNLNGPWVKPERQNMHRVLYIMGAFRNRKSTWLPNLYTMITSMKTTFSDADYLLWGDTKIPIFRQGCANHLGGSTLFHSQPIC